MLPIEMFLSSLLLNLSLLLLGEIWLKRKGGINYLRSKLTVSAPQLRSPYYLHRCQQLELLKISPDSIVFLGDSITNEDGWNGLASIPSAIAAFPAIRSQA